MVDKPVDRVRLDGLKDGDRVSLWDGWHHRLAKVDRVTATQIHIGAIRYRRKDGQRIGGGTWCRDSIAEPTPDVVATIREKADRRAIGEVEWRFLPIEKVRAVLEIVRDVPKSADAQR